MAVLALGAALFCGTVGAGERPGRGAATGGEASVDSAMTAGHAAEPGAATYAWSDCALTTSMVEAAGVAKARELLESLWLAEGQSLFAAYTMPGEQRNPFDRQPAAVPPAGPRDGIVEVRAPQCRYRAVAEAGSLVVRFATPFYRFHEAGAGWSPPLRNGLMLEVVVEPGSRGWQARDAGSATTILLPDQKARRPAASELPKSTRWAPPVPGCGRGETWNGTDCLRRR